MRKICTTITACLMAIVAMAQTANPVVPSTDSIPTVTDSIRTVTDSTQALTDSIARLNAIIAANHDSLASKDRQIALLQAKCDEMEQQQGAMTQLSSVIFKQCLLYPLEARYSAKDIQDAITCLNELGIWDNPLYKADCDIYRPMLTSYGRFNSQIMAIVEQSLTRLQQKQQMVEGYRLTREEASWIADDIRQTDYYQYFARRNNPPYKSIVYLDENIENLLNLLNHPEDITIEALNKVLERLRPKQN